MTEREARKELMRRALEISPTVHVGKDGLKDSVFEEVSAQLKKNRLIKIRVLANAEDDAAGTAEELASRTNGVVVDVRGGVIVMTDSRTWRALCEKKF